MPFFEMGVVRMSPMVQRAIDERGCAQHAVSVFFPVSNFSNVATSVVVCQYAFGHLQCSALGLTMVYNLQFNFLLYKTKNDNNNDDDNNNDTNKIIIMVKYNNQLKQLTHEHGSYICIQRG
jgi:hypothetical protein